MQIRLENVERSYGFLHAVNGISLSIPTNSIYGVIGRSGAGKSTLVRLVSLLERPDSGTVFYDGQRVDDLDEQGLILQRRRLGMIFQNFNLFSSRSAGQNVSYPLEIAGYKSSDIKERVKELLDLVGLGDREKAPISTLSGGQKQRIAIARALAVRPDILFCDEATSALDPQTTHSILSLLKEIQSKMNLTIVMITHQMEVVRDSCERVAVLDDGKVVEEGLVTDIFAHPQTTVTRDFLSHLSPVDASPSEHEEGLVRWSEDGGRYTLRFRGGNTDLPILSQLSRKFEVEFNIRAGGVQNVGGEKIGTLISDISGTPDVVAAVIAELKKQGVYVEEARS
ncbi:methionine ABC transporter ATP-binding protein [Parasphaerochaeta coccoides]|uniref:Sulfate-transporting ATPase n=1 Tax=Parasphaerochaeta coccoides (strain ATCC BAA-1237 / DSM 17374 / SPN1) TaxID=760011 RepID=F4GKQ0_PARC1|nr:methionine ABC transporter ATP-binding protein [Parasphaerochaeta coccoides]AEC01459.1 Sulfate-transporting ATPase [Parasphaerochaeta coccoides DSM 17374]